MKTYVKTSDNFSTFNFTSKFYAGIVACEVVMNIQPVYSRPQPKQIMLLVANRANGDFWSIYDNEPMIDIEELDSFISTFPSLEIYEFDTAEEKFTWIANNI